MLLPGYGSFRFVCFEKLCRGLELVGVEVNSVRLNK